LNLKKYFGLEVKVRGAGERPKSCLIDGLQLSTGATYGKGNIKKINGRRIEIIFKSRENSRQLKFILKNATLKKLNRLKGHNDSEVFAKKLYRTCPLEIFNINSYN
ncbi:MAG: hypothetical protein DRP74_05825, partial [Candidatus Omnitrophota bacterium]